MLRGSKIKNYETPKIIAEIGINHNGQLDIALKMIEQAHRAGAWAVKFQKRNVDYIYADILDMPRDDGNPYGWTTQGEQKHGLELTYEDYERIDSYCFGLGIAWFASAWDLWSLDFMQRFRRPDLKIASAMATNHVFLTAVATLDPAPERVFLSTGGCTMAEVSRALELLKPSTARIIPLHCVGLYPCPLEKTNLNRMIDLAILAGPPVGFSGHAVGIQPYLMAIDWGAEYVECHITLDRGEMYGSDQAASIEISGLTRLVEHANNAQAIAGGTDFDPTEEELAVINKLRRLP
jgi:N-acetylneuraminate synthase